jgi:phosphoglycerate kinase
MLNNKVPLLRNTVITPGMHVLVRADYNVPIEKGEIKSEFRILRSLETINYLKERGAKILLVSHIESTDTLESVSDFLKKCIPHTFIRNSDITESNALLDDMKEGDVLLFENIRQNPGEKKNDEGFARSLASFVDLYVNDAFSVSHRKHASIVGVPLFVSGCAGFLLEKEMHELASALHPKKPLLFVLGGAKFETKLPLVTKFMDIASTIIIGGALANDIYKARGFEVGKSLVSGQIDLSEITENENIRVPSEVVVKRKESILTISTNSIENEDIIIDASTGWVRGLKEMINEAGTILWNGPIGKYEEEGKGGTTELAKLIAESEAYSIVGGGDTLAVIEENNLEEKFDFISTGGGAMLDFLAHGTLPGIEALSENH